jgi:signal peptidase
MWGPQPQKPQDPPPQAAPVAKAEGSAEDGAEAAREIDPSKAMLAKIVSLVSNVMSVALIALIVFVVYSAAAGGGERGIALGPLRFYSVLTASMEPAISQGSVIATVKPKEQGLKKGDIVTFVPADGSSTLVTHRIVKAGPEPDSYITRGDANNVDDREIKFDQVVGRHVLTIPFLGLVIYPLASPLSTVWLASIAMLFVLMLWIIKKIFQDQEKDEEEGK